MNEVIKTLDVDGKTCFGFSPKHLLHGSGRIIASGTILEVVTACGYLTIELETQDLKGYWWWQTSRLMTESNRSNALNLIAEASKACYNKLCKVLGSDSLDKFLS